MKVLLVFLVLELTAVAVVDCLKCYSCVNCNDPFEDSSSIETTSCFYGQCMKIKEKVGKVQVVSRDCSEGFADNKCEKETVYNIDREVCYCNTDRCNGTSAVGTSLISLLLLAVVAVKITLLTL